MKLPKEIWVYWADTIDDEPLYGVALSIEDIPHENSGEIIGHYKLERKATFVVERKVK